MTIAKADKRRGGLSLRRLLSSGVAVSVAAMGLALAMTHPASAVPINDEPFTHPRVLAGNVGMWKEFTKDGSNPVCLTAATKSTDTTGSLPACQPVLNG